ncbi:MAG: response regulator [Proteobacteria bacterium]|nr:response regulator [Pseudomonadota bacterium]
MLEPKTILTVDDSRTMRDLLGNALREAGYSVVQAGDGQEALGALDSIKPDLIITDINMPRMGGFNFIDQVRRNPRHRATPILVLTTESAPELKERARKSGATGWIVKPFDPARLLDAIRKVGV